MRIKTLDYDPANVDANGICEDQTPAAGGVQALSLDGALISGGTFTDSTNMARQLLMTTSAADQGKNLVITGTDADDNPETETIALPNATTGETVKYFKTISSITVSADTIGTVAVGTVDEVLGKIYPLNHRSPYGAHISVDVTGTANFTIEETYDDLQLPGYPVDALWTDATAAGAIDVLDTMGVGATAFRVKVNSYTDTAEMQITVTQPGEFS